MWEDIEILDRNILGSIHATQEARSAWQRVRKNYVGKKCDHEFQVGSETVICLKCNTVYRIYEE